MNTNPTLTLKIFTNLNEPSTSELILIIYYKWNKDLGAIEIWVLLDGLNVIPLVVHVQGQVQINAPVVKREI